MILTTKQMYEKCFENYVTANQQMLITDEIKAKYSRYDVLVGPTADDKLFNTIQSYIEGETSPETAVKCLNSVGYSNQIVLVSQKAIDKLQFLTSHELTGAEKQFYKDLIVEDRMKANRIVSQIKKGLL